MLRICLIIAIVGGLAAGVINFIKVKEVIATVVQQRNDETAAKVTAQNDLRKTKADLAATKKDLDGTKSKLAQTTKDLQAATAKAADLDKQAADLTAQLAKTKADRDAAQQKLAQWDQMDMNPLQVKTMKEDNKKLIVERDSLTAENKLLIKKRNELQSKLDEFVGSDQPPVLPTGLKGKVLVVDPKYDFVVLDIGENKGVLPRGELMVDRDGKLIAKVRVSSVQKDRSIANIMPGWTQSDVMEGDQVIY
jgi:hypothetical protein